MSGLMDLKTTRPAALFGRTLPHLAGLGVGRVVVRVRTVKANAVRPAAGIDLGADDVPALAEVQHAVVQLGGPAPRRDADPVLLPHRAQSMPVRARGMAVTKASPPQAATRTRPRRRSG